MFGLPCCSAGQSFTTACACFWSVRHSSPAPPSILQHSAGVGIWGLSGVINKQGCSCYMAMCDRLINIRCDGLVFTAADSRCVAFPLQSSAHKGSDDHRQN